MPATRPKLILDEQAFQGLLAAAFTVQQHNDRQKLNSNSVAADKPHPLADPFELCGHCAAPLPTDAASCSVCGAENLRPGERLQRTWASMWLMSQEHGVRHDPPDDAGADAPLVHRSGDGHHPAAGDVSTPLANAKPAGAKVPAEASGFAPGPSSSAASSLPNAAPDLSREDIEWPPEHSDQSRLPFPSASLSPGGSSVLHEPSHADGSLAERLLGDPSLDDSAPFEASLPDSSLDDSSFDDSSFDDLSLIDPTAETPGLAPNAGSGLFERLHKLSFDRADLYLTIAFLVAAAALMWPAATSPRRHLSPWERVLVAMGIAEAPPPAVHYRGDPEIKVWVDTHTALYYCPGDELYGKSPDGHFTTQREAQAERFEPAQGSACIQ